MGAQNLVKEIKQYQKKWLQHVQRMDTNRLPKQALQYKPKGRKKVGRPRKRWRANFILRIKEQETRLTLHEHNDDDEISAERESLFGRKLLKSILGLMEQVMPSVLKFRKVMQIYIYMSFILPSFCALPIVQCFKKH